MKTIAPLILCGFFFCEGIAQSPPKKVLVAADSTKAAKKSYIVKQEIVVEADRTATATQAHHCTTIESALKAEPCISLIRRGNFALEPTLRGMSGGQIAITIDGMKMHSACVDRMDPITAYVEPENLHQLEVSTGYGDVSAAQTQGGTLNLVTVKPNFAERFSGSGELGFGNNSQLARVRANMNYAMDNTAVRGSFSVKRSGDYSAGNSMLIANSGFQKENYKIDILHKLTSEQDISLSYIRDDARNIGYPALIMDAAKTQSNIMSVDYKVREISKLIPLATAKLYWNTVDHLMDDYSRSKTEIEKREIMSGMYMPMDGTTQTAGLIADAILAANNQTLKLTVDIFHLSAFADMTMLPVSGGAKMHLVNLAGVDNLNTALAADWNYEPVSSDFRYRIAARMDYSRRSLTDTEGKNAFAAFWNSDNLTRNYSAAGINSAIEYTAEANTTVRLSVARASRLPTHIENYGFYLYNPLDNAIYMGNPDLEPERGWQGEFGVQYRTDDIQLKANTFVNYIENYIAGRTIIKPDPNNTQFPQAFRRYESIGAASIVGMEADCSLKFSDEWNIRATYRLQSGRAIQLSESLPWMPPMEMTTNIHWEHNEIWAEFGCRIAARQRNISRTISTEDETPGFAVFDIRGRIPIGAGIVISGGIDNILDKYYWDYSSVRNLPVAGRNIFLSAAIVF